MKMKIIINSSSLMLIASIIISLLFVSFTSAEFKSPFVKFCKFRLSTNDFTSVGIYHKQLESSDKGQRLIELLYDSITTDDRNRYRNGGYKVRQDNDHRMKEIDDLLFKDEQIKTFRRDLRARSFLAFDCVDEFEMQASGRALVEDLDTGRERRPNMKMVRDLHGALSEEDLVETGGYDADGVPIPADIPDDDDHDEDVYNKRNSHHPDSDSDHHNAPELLKDGEDEKPSMPTLTRHEQMQKSLDERKARGEAYRHQSGVNPRTAHFYQHATEHFKRHEEAKRAHLKYQDQVLNQRLQQQKQQRQGGELADKRSSPDAIHQEHLQNIQKQQRQQLEQDTKKSFDHMQNHFKQHHDHMEAAQRRRIQDANEEARKLQETQIRDRNRNIAHEKLGLYNTNNKKSSKTKSQNQHHQPTPEEAAAARAQKRPQGERPKHVRISEHRQSKFQDENNMNGNQQQQEKDVEPPRRLHDDPRNGGSHHFKASLHSDPLNDGGFEQVVGKEKYKQH